MMKHPFYPLDLKLPNYIPIQRSLTEILLTFFGGLFIMLGISCIYYFNKKVKGLKNRIAFIWFLTCGLIHTFFEGYFVYNNKTMSQDTSLFGEIWKEYAKSDSRYLTSDSAVLMIEFITAVFWGPLSFYILCLIATQPDSAPRYYYQAFVSMGQAYGCVLYYLTTLIENSPHCRPENYYFWFYFIFMNAFWIIFPTFFIWDTKNFMIKLDNSKIKKKKK